MLAYRFALIAKWYPSLARRADCGYWRVLAARAEIRAGGVCGALDGLSGRLCPVLIVSFRGVVIVECGVGGPAELTL